MKYSMLCESIISLCRFLLIKNIASHEGNIKIISKTGTKLALVKEVKSFLKSSEAEFKEDQRKLLADIQKLKDQK